MDVASTKIGLPTKYGFGAMPQKFIAKNHLMEEHFPKGQRMVFP
jgi:hypothetical protein